MSHGINDYLRNLEEKSKLNKILTDDHTDVSVSLDLYTAEYKGARIRFELDDKTVDLNTEDLRVVVYGEKKTTSKLDQIIALAIDYQVVSTFNIHKIDEDYFDDLKDSLKDDLKDLHESESAKVYEKIVQWLEDIKDSDYDEEIIKNQLKKYDINDKTDHFIITRDHKGTSIKYNTEKNKFTLKNTSSYKKKFTPDEVVADFDNHKFDEVIRDIVHKKIYNDRRLDLDDGLSDLYSSLGRTSYLEDGDLSDEI